MTKQTVSEKLIASLVHTGVKRIYGLIGDSLNPIGNAVRLSKQIDWISVRHEEAAAIACGAEAFLTKNLCVCAGTSGPGSVHLINGLYEANRNKSPVLALVTDLPISEAGLDYFQNTTPMHLYQDCSVFCQTLSSPSQMPRLLQEAMQTALSKSGVAVLILPKDVCEAIVEDSPFERSVRSTKTSLVPDMSDIENLADIINAHQKVTLYCGIGCCNAKTQVLDLSDTLKAPIVCTFRSKDFMENGVENNVGLNGNISLWESAKALKNCDLLVLLGTDFPFEKVIPKTPTIVQIDICAKHLGRRSRLDFGLHSDIRSALDLLLPLLKEKKDDAHLKQSKIWKNKKETEKQENLKKYSQTKPLRPEYLTAVVDKIADEQTVFAIDVGLNDVWAARYLTAQGTRRIIGSFLHGTMAAAIPTAMGAYYADPSRPVIALVGDGSLAMLMGELLTIVQHQIPIKIVVYNNGELGFIRYEANLERIPAFEIELKNPNFAKMAEVIGIKSVRVDTPENLEHVLRLALETKGPVLIEAITDPLALA